MIGGCKWNQHKTFNDFVWFYRIGNRAFAADTTDAVHPTTELTGVTPPLSEPKIENLVTPDHFGLNVIKHTEANHIGWDFEMQYQGDHDAHGGWAFITAYVTMSGDMAEILESWGTPTQVEWNVTIPVKWVLKKLFQPDGHSGRTTVGSYLWTWSASFVVQLINDDPGLRVRLSLGWDGHELGRWYTAVCDVGLHMQFNTALLRAFTGLNDPTQATGVATGLEQLALTVAADNVTNGDNPRCESGADPAEVGEWALLG